MYKQQTSQIMKKQLLLIFCLLVTLCGCHRDLREINYKFSVALQDSVFNGIEVGTEISTPILFHQKLEQPQYRVKFSYRDDLGTILFVDKELKNSEEIEIKDVKNLRLGYRALAVGKDTIHIEISNAMMQQQITMAVSSVAKTGVTFPAYSFYESYSPNIAVKPTPMLIINNPADKENSYKLIFERTEGTDLQGWMIDGDEKREMVDKQEMSLFSGVGVKSYRFEFLCKKPSTQKFRLVVLDKYGNRFESDEYTLQFEVKGKVDFPVFNFEESYSPNKKFRSKAILRLHNLTDKDNVYTVHYKPISSDILWLQLVDGEQEYLLSKLKSVKLPSQTGEIACYFDLNAEKQGTQKFILEVSDKYGNTYKSPEYTISFKAKANIFFPKLSSEEYQTHVSNFVKGERLKVQGIEDPNNEFFASFEILKGQENGFSMSLIQNSIEGVKLTQGEWYSITKGTNEESFQYEFRQKKQGTTEFRVLVKDKYGNIYKSPVYKPVFKDKYYAKVELTMSCVDRWIPIHLDHYYGDPRRGEKDELGLLEIFGTKDVNSLKRFLANDEALTKLEQKSSARYIYSINVKIYSDPEMTKSENNFLSSEDEINMVITAPSEVYNLVISEEIGRFDRRWYSRKGKFQSETIKDFSVVVAPTKYKSINGALIVGLDNVLNYRINRAYSLIPNETSSSTLGSYPIGIFFGEITGVRSISFVHKKHKNIELSPKIDVYKKDRYGSKPYFLKTLETQVRN